MTQDEVPKGTPPVEERDTHEVPEGTPPTRLDRYASQVLERLLSVHQAHDAARKGNLRLNGQICEPCRFVRPGDRIALWGGGRCLAPVWMQDLGVVYEDDVMAVIHKPPGPIVSGTRRHTIENALPYNLRPSTAPDALPTPRPVHRLDARTGGLLLVAKTSSAAASLCHSLETHAVRKRYRALVIGRLEGEGEVDLPLDGRASLTRYRAVEHTRSLLPGWLTTVDAWPVTGRTHQIRRHLAHLGHPVLGDEVYGLEGLILRGQGLHLWAVELWFPHPDDGREMNLRVEEPPKFESHRRREARRWERVHGGAE